MCPADDVSGPFAHSTRSRAIGRPGRVDVATVTTAHTVVLARQARLIAW